MLVYQRVDSSMGPGATPKNFRLAQTWPKLRIAPRPKPGRRVAPNQGFLERSSTFRGTTWHRRGIVEVIHSDGLISFIGLV